MNVWAEFVLVDDVEPVVVNILSSSKARAPIRVLVFGEGVPMGANVASTASQAQKIESSENESEMRTQKVWR